MCVIMASHCFLVFSFAKYGFVLNGPFPYQTKNSTIIHSSPNIDEELVSVEAYSFI